MEIHDRLRKLIDDEGLSISGFERIIGVGQNSVSTCLRRYSSISHHVLIGIKNNFPHYSLEWLLTGEDSENKETILNIKNTLKELEKEVNSIK